MDEKAETGGGDASSEIIDLAYWQRFVLEEVMHIVEAQDYTIMKLQGLVRTDQEKELYFKPSRSSLRAIRSLSNLFQTDALFHGETVGVPQLKAWCLAHEFDFDQVVNSFGEIKERQPSELSLEGALVLANAIKETDTQKDESD